MPDQQEGSQSGQLTSGTKAAIGIGVVLAVLLLGLLAASIMIRQRWKRRQDTLRQGIGGNVKYLHGDHRSKELNSNPVHQLDSQDRPYELEQPGT